MLTTIVVAIGAVLASGLGLFQLMALIIAGLQILGGYLAF